MTLPLYRPSKNASSSMSLHPESVGMPGVPRDHQHEGLDDGLSVLAGVDLQLDFGVLVNANAVFQFQPLQSRRVIVLRIEVFAGRHGGFLDEPVRHGAR